jgi:hypothetical protein
MIRDLRGRRYEQLRGTSIMGRRIKAVLYIMQGPGLVAQ